MINKNQKIGIIVAQQDFQDEEYFIPKSVFETAGFGVDTISERIGDGLGTFGGVIKIDSPASQVKVADYKALFFVGGSGMGFLLENADFQRIAQEAFRLNKVIGAVSIAPALLALAKILTGKKATVWTNGLDNKAVKMLKDTGCIYTEEPLVADGQIITANSPTQARKLAETILNVLGEI
ncbi:MAG: DJ-1/PfpI family protein [Candidatus Gribaldobacteria bacterium]|nr:DJ-1/PfpI family protein [Candidatus Gribaldobacteria bacterium]